MGNKDKYNQLASILCSLILFVVFLPLHGQVALKVNSIYSTQEGDIAQVKVFQDSKLIEEGETNKKGKYKTNLNLGHYYLIEFSKKYHFTTKFVMDLKLPQEIIDQKPYLPITIDIDLIENYSGLDGSVMESPIMVMKWYDEAQVLDFDTAHLARVRSEVDALMEKAEELKSKGVKRIADPQAVVAQEVKKAETTAPEIEPKKVVEEESMVKTPTHKVKEEAAPEKVPEIVESPEDTTEGQKDLEPQKETKKEIAEEQKRIPKEEMVETKQDKAVGTEKKQADLKSKESGLPDQRANEREEVAQLETTTEEEQPPPAEKEEIKANETYEMQLRKQRIQKEKQRKENLALKRGYEMNLIKQVAEEKRRMSQAEINRKTTEREDSSLIAKAERERELKAFKNAQREKERLAQEQAENNKNIKTRQENDLLMTVSQGESGMLKDRMPKPKGQATEDGEKYHMPPVINYRETRDEFKSAGIAYIDAPSGSREYRMEEYYFGMQAFYINGQTVEQEAFCDTIKSWNLTNKFKPCE